MGVTLDWLGCATFRLQIDEFVIFLDGYIDRVPSAPSVGISAAEVDRADAILVGHAHFDHIAGAELIARNTGARVVCSTESARMLANAGVDESKLLPSQGGERHNLTSGIVVTTFPSLHSCVWVGDVEAGGMEAGGTDTIVTGHLGLTEDERAAVQAEHPYGADADPELLAQMQEHIASSLHSDHTGGALAYLIETPYGSIFYHDTSGCWTGVVRDLQPDFAIVAMAGRANIDGEPIQGSLAQFVGRMADMLRPQRMVLGHHDDWMPPVTSDGTSEESMAPVRAELARIVPRMELLEVGYLEGTTNLD
jgi:L-ascorbate metabolism protein UlaG (beta-lactamase superfamily)